MLCPPGKVWIMLENGSEKVVVYNTVSYLRNLKNLLQSFWFKDRQIKYPKLTHR